MVYSQRVVKVLWFENTFINTNLVIDMDNDRDVSTFYSLLNEPPELTITAAELYFEKIRRVDIKQSSCAKMVSNPSEVRQQFLSSMVV